MPLKTNVDLVTGGARSRDVSLLMTRAELFQRHHAHDADGCLDAPETMPAGACNSVDWKDWRGKPLAGQSEVRR